MNKNELKAQLEAAQDKEYELEDKVNATAQKCGKDSAEFAALYTEWADARRKVVELDAQYRELERIEGARLDMNKEDRTRIIRNANAEYARSFIRKFERAANEAENMLQQLLADYRIALTSVEDELPEYKALRAKINEFHDTLEAEVSAAATRLYTNH